MPGSVEMWTQWEHGLWSEWYVPGMNDIDIKFNVQTAFCRDYDVRANSMRRDGVTSTSTLTSSFCARTKKKSQKNKLTA